MNSAPGTVLYRWMSTWLAGLAALPFLSAPVLADNLVSTSQVEAAVASPVGVYQSYVVPRSGNASTIIQNGNSNVAETDQTGTFDDALITQQGNNDVSIIRQSSLGNNAVNTQTGNGLTMTITQTGPAQNIAVNQHN